MSRFLGGLAAALCTLALLHGRGEAAVCQLSPGPEGEDSAPYSFIPTLNRGQHETLYAFKAFDAGVEHTFETYLRFLLPAGFPGALITNATLVEVYAFDFTGFGDTTATPGVLRVHQVLAPWSEASLTWNTRPAIGPVLDDITGITQVPVPTPVYLTFDVTSTVAAWATGAATNHGFALTSPAGRVMGFHSFEADFEGVESVRAALLISTTGTPADTDSDCSFDTLDNCVYEFNSSQLDPGGVGATAPNGIGTACECGDVTDDGSVLSADATEIRYALAGLAGGPDVARKCNVIGPVNAVDGPDENLLRDDCALDDVVVLRRALVGRAPGIGSVCEPALP